MKILFLILFISLPLFANDCLDCSPSLAPEGAKHNLEEFSKKLEQWGASSSQVMNSACKSKTFDVEVMHKTLSSMTGNEDKKIRGVQFENEAPQLLTVFKNLTVKNKSPWWQTPFLKSPPEVSLQILHSINPECRKVLCAVDKIWGQFLGRKMLYMNLKFGFNPSEISNSNAAPFSESEIDDVLLGLQDLPKSFMPMVNNRKLIKYHPDEAHPDKGPLVWADSRIALFAPWFQATQGLRFYTLAHELGHVLHEKIPDSKKTEFSALSSWVKVGDNWEFDLIGACMPSTYAMTSPYEDFAESTSAYRYNARALLAQCPAKYNFLKNSVFAGVEFLEESQCSGK